MPGFKTLNLNDQNNKLQQSKQILGLLTKIIYGIQCKVYKDLLFLPATVYLDPWYPNIFLWVATDQQSYLFDISFINISCYSLELELSIKNDSAFKGNQMPRYIIIKDFNLEISIIFSQKQQNSISSQQNIQKFIQGKKPSKEYKLLKHIIQKVKKQIQINKNQVSSGFSRFLKLVRLAMEKQSVNLSKITTTQPGIRFPIQIMKKIYLKILEIYNFSQRKTIISFIFTKQKKSLDFQQIIQSSKVLYCHLNVKLLKNFIPKLQLLNKNIEYCLTQKIISMSLVNKKQIRQKLYSCFSTIMRLQNFQQNYIICEHKVNQQYSLTDYFCFSSHNTYLTGNQLTSDCKITRYIEDLKKGIKCVELDVHNDGSNQPIITHAIKGKGFCKPISFRSTIQAIDQYLQFHPHHFPIILSIENHASKENQDLMNNILLREFNKFIVKPKINGNFYQLKQLKGKIIVKTSCGMDKLLKLDIDKPLNNNIKQNQGQFNIFQHEQEINQNYNQIPHDSEIQKLNYQSFIQKTNTLKRLKNMFNTKIDQNMFTPMEKIAQITCMFKAPKGIDTQNVSPFQCTSMINNKITKNHKQKITNYTKKAWMRSYPQGTQINSSNYDFLELLARGVQIIALNTQTNDDYAIMMISYFTAGRRGTMENFGFILKPQYLLSSYNQTPKIQTKRHYKFIFYTQLILEFKIYSLQALITNLNSSNILKSSLTYQSSCVKIQFKNLKSFNESFLIIYIKERNYVECIPLRFLEPTLSKKKTIDLNGRQYRTIIARDYQYQDTGIRILCEYECIQE